MRNNGFAISTPSTQQYAGDGIASRGVGYGMPALRVDGNDALAARMAVQAARDVALSRHVPVLLELMSYRVGHHSTSDDSSAYRPRQSVEDWKRLDNPLERMRRFLTIRGWWSDVQQKETTKAYRARVIEQMSSAEKKDRPALSTMFTGTYAGAEGSVPDDVPDNLARQRSELARLVNQYKDYPPWTAQLKKHEHQGSDLDRFLS